MPGEMPLPLSCWCLLLAELNRKPKGRKEGQRSPRVSATQIRVEKRESGSSKRRGWWPKGLERGQCHQIACTTGPWLENSSFRSTRRGTSFWNSPVTKGGSKKIHSCFRCCCCSVTKLCPTLCDPMDYSTPGFPVLHCLLEFTQVHVHWVGDAIQPSHPLSSSSPPPSNLSQHQNLFHWAISSHQVANIGASASASVLPMNIQDWFSLGWTGWISLLSKGFSKVCSNTTLQKHQFFSAQLSLWSSSHICTWLLRKP